MANECRQCYYFKGGLNVELIHFVNNRNVAKKAMFNADGKTRADITHSQVG